MPMTSITETNPSAHGTQVISDDNIRHPVISPKNQPTQNMFSKKPPKIPKSKNLQKPNELEKLINLQDWRNN